MKVNLEVSVRIFCTRLKSIPKICKRISKHVSLSNVPPCSNYKKNRGKNIKRFLERNN